VGCDLRVAARLRCRVVSNAHHPRSSLLEPKSTSSLWNETVF
jgi:hypothetical protein